MTNTDLANRLGRVVHGRPPGIAVAIVGSDGSRFLHDKRSEARRLVTLGPTNLGMPAIRVTLRPESCSTIVRRRVAAERWMTVAVGPPSPGFSSGGSYGTTSPLARVGGL